MQDDKQMLHVFTTKIKHFFCLFYTFAKFPGKTSKIGFRCEIS